jgi:hypothetical protein
MGAPNRYVGKSSKERLIRNKRLIPAFNVDPWVSTKLVTIKSFLSIGIGFFPPVTKLRALRHHCKQVVVGGMHWCPSTGMLGA